MKQLITNEIFFCLTSVFTTRHSNKRCLQDSYIDSPDIPALSALATNEEIVIKMSGVLASFLHLSPASFPCQFALNE